MTSPIIQMMMSPNNSIFEGAIIGLGCDGQVHVLGSDGEWRAWPADEKSEYLYFNVNEYVEVRLTDDGRKFLEKTHDAMYKEYPTIGKYKPPVEVDGWSKWQMHELMEQLGSQCTMAGLAFYTNIRFKRDVLKEPK